MKAIRLRVLADEQEKQAKLAQRIFDAKWKRLEEAAGCRRQAEATEEHLRCCPEVV